MDGSLTVEWYEKQEAPKSPGCARVRVRRGGCEPVCVAAGAVLDREEFFMSDESFAFSTTGKVLMALPLGEALKEIGSGRRRLTSLPRAFLRLADLEALELKASSVIDGLGKV